MNKELQGLIDADLKRRGTTVEAVLDPECFGTPMEKLRAKWRRLLYITPINFRLLCLGEFRLVFFGY